MKWWPFKKKRKTRIIIASVDDPLDPHGDGTLRPGDAVYDVIMKALSSGESSGVVYVYRLGDGTWAMEIEE